MISWLPMAFAASPTMALRAVACLVRGYRVRGRNLIAAAASRHKNFYASWVRRIEPQLITDWCSSRKGCCSNISSVCAVIVHGEREDGTQARENVKLALGARSLMDPGDDLLATLQVAGDKGFEWILFVPAEDRLSPRLGEVFARLGEVSRRNIVYWDHDYLINGRRSLPVIKPDWDPVLAESLSLFGSSAVMRITTAIAIAQAIGKLTVCSADIERLQVAAARGDPQVTPLHLPLILTHRGVSDPEPRSGHARPFGYPVTWPGVTIVIPTRDQAELLAACIAGLDQLAYRGEIETIILDNDSVDAEAIALLAALQSRPGTRVVPWPGVFNFAAMMNDAAALASKPVLCLLNNDVTPLDSEWLDHLVAAAIQPGCGAAGARLLYPDGTIQHVGVALGLGGAAGHVQKGVNPAQPQFANWHQVTRRVAAVTAACLVVQKQKYLDVGGMDADLFGVDFNDVDLCLKLDRAGLANRIVVEATLIHHESKSRGTRRTIQQQQQFESELQALRLSWGTLDAIDPWYSPLFRRESEQCQLRL